MIKHRFDALVFDLDGTLIESLPAVLSALNRTFADLSLRPLQYNELTSMIGHGARVMIERALQAIGGDAEAHSVEEVAHKYLQAYLDDPAANTMIFPGVLETLSDFQDQGIKMGICTNKPSATTMPAIEALQLDRFFQSVRCGDAVEYPKPNGRHILTVLDDLGSPASSAAYFGDTDVDVLAARDAEVPIVITDYTDDKKITLKFPNTPVVSSFWDAPSALTGLL